MKNIFKNVNPAVLLLLAMLLLNNMLSTNQSLISWLYDKVLILPGILIGLTFHEAAHGFASYKLGDPTPKIQGRLSLNPLDHIDPIGFLALFFAGFGWGKPVEINPMYYKNRRRDEIIVSLAGIVTNLIIAILSCFALRFITDFAVSHGLHFGIVLQTVINILAYMMSINVCLAVFNLIPIPPLDGFGVVTEIFNLRKYNWYYPLYSNGFLILMIMILFNIIDIILDPAVAFVYDIVLKIGMIG